MNELELYAVSGSELRPLPVPAEARDVHGVFAGVPNGIYSALRTYPQHRFLRLDAHLERCRRCVARAGWRTSFDYEGLRHALDQAVRARGPLDMRVRFDLLENSFERAGGAHILLGIAPHEPVSERALTRGVRLGLAPDGLARVEPLIKFTEWVTRRTVCVAADPSAYEHLLLDTEGHILEGTSSNFFALRGGSLITAGDGVLEGITMQVVMELAVKRGLELSLRALRLDELRTCDEAFITSSTREVVPVTAVGETVIGGGVVGPVVQALAADYSVFADAHAQRAAG
jgi:branched-chain amino acid aminotransferase